MSFEFEDSLNENRIRNDTRVNASVMRSTSKPNFAEFVKCQITVIGWDYPTESSTTCCISAAAFMRPVISLHRLESSRVVHSQWCAGPQSQWNQLSLRKLTASRAGGMRRLSLHCVLPHHLQRTAHSRFTTAKSTKHEATLSHLQQHLSPASPPTDKLRCRRTLHWNRPSAQGVCPPNFTPI